MPETFAETKDSKIELGTDRLLLRGAVPGDAEYLYDAFGDLEAMRYWSEATHKDLTRTREWVSGMIKNEQNGVTDFVICLKPDNRPIGKIGVWSGDEIGFIFARSHWHKGLAKEAMNRILPYLFDVRGFDSISSDIDPRNQASRGLLQKFGFEDERFAEKTFKIGDEWVDSQYMRLTKERWNRYRSS